MSAYVYILTNKPWGVLYVGVTTDIARRVYEHRTESVPGFTQRYHLKRLVYVEIFDDVLAAIAREKQIKRYPRAYKFNLITEQNPEWRDLYESLI
jgi:putative endonuclease